MSADSQPSPRQLEPPGPSSCLAVLLGAALGCVVVLALVFVYYGSIPESSKGGEAGFALIGEFARDVVAFGALGAVAGALLGWWLARARDGR